jgi:methylmalonyl-CoA mutase N-terminal domain/subunit
VRARRDSALASAARAALEEAASEERNLMPPILACVRAELTLGEISDSLRHVYGEHREGDLG